MCWLLQRIVIQKVFPVLAEEFYNNIMIPFVLPNVLLIAEESSIQEYSTLILPALRPVFTVQNPIQVYMYMCVCVCMHVCVCFVCLCVCVCVCVCVCMLVCVHACVCVVCECVCVCLSVSLCLYLCVHFWLCYADASFEVAIKCTL